MRARLAALVAVGLVACSELPPPNVVLVTTEAPPPADPEYVRVVERVAAMVTDPELSARVSRRGLSLVNVTWEDTGRALGSSIGPNISDFTLQVRHGVAVPGELGSLVEDAHATHWTQTLMPVIRTPNFADVTGDIPADRFFVRVGNARGTGLVTVPLIDVIRDLGRYASSPGALGRGVVDLSAPRDTHFLVSAQALFLPIPRRGAAEFNPVLFNYQSAPESPAVLTLLATREGTSIAVIENRPSDAGIHWGQELYFDEAGRRAYFTAERRSDVAARIAAQGGPRAEADVSALARGADVMALVQIPLVHQNRGVLPGVGYNYMFSDDPLSASGFGPNDATIRVRSGPSDVERAVLGHGSVAGPFVEGYGTPLVRDATFPIRVTIQFYKATATGEVSDADLDGIVTSLGSVYAHADTVGSLVLPEGDSRRPTAWQHVPGAWFPF